VVVVVVVVNFIGAQGFGHGPFFELNAPPLNVGDPDGSHCGRRIGKFLFCEIERGHIRDPFPELLEGNALFGFLDEYIIQQDTQIPRDREAFLPKQVWIGAVAIVVGMLDGRPGTVTSDKGEENHAK